MLRKFLISTLFLASTVMLAVFVFSSTTASANIFTKIGDFLFGSDEFPPPVVNNITNPTVVSPITTVSNNTFTDQELYAALSRIKLPQSIIDQLRGPQGPSGPKGNSGTGGTTIINPPGEPDTIVYNTYTSSGGGSHSAASDWRTSGDDVFYTKGNVGIGTSEPEAKLNIDASGADTSPLIIKTNGSVGNYTPANSGIFVYDAAGTEILRIFASDPDDFNNYNSANLYIGKEAGAANTTDNTSAGYYNTGIGFKALNSNTIGLKNTAVGTFALRSNISGSYNDAFGRGALLANTTGNENTAIGENSLFNNTTGSSNTALNYALVNNTTGSFNVALGEYTLLSNTTGNYNTVIGYSGGYFVTGSRNTLLGPATIAASRSQVTSGSNNIAIGNDVAVASATANNQLNIGNLIYGTGLDGTGATVSTGNIGIGTKTPIGPLEVNGSVNVNNLDAVPFVRFKNTLDSSAGITSLMLDTTNASAYTGLIFKVAGTTKWDWSFDNDINVRDVPNSFNTVFTIKSGGLIGINNIAPSVALDVTGDIEYTGTITDVSDRRLKENITDYTGALEIISNLQAKNYNMIGSNKEEVGFLAQDVQNLFPSATSVIDPTNGYLGVSYVSLVPVISQALRELNIKVDTLATLSLEDESWFNKLTAKLGEWLADATNGITRLFVKEIHTDELCVGSVCVTEEEFLNIVGENHSSTNNEPAPPEPEAEEVAPAPTEDLSAEESIPEIPAEETPEATPEPETPPAVE